MKNFKDYLKESENALPEAGDAFDFELLNDTLIETTVLEVVEDGVVVALDEAAAKILAAHGHYLEERAVSKAQQRFMGMVHAAQKGEKPASKEVAKVAKGMGKKDAKDFAATKHKGLPGHVDEGYFSNADVDRQEANRKGVTINGKPVEVDSLEVDGVHHWDAPDFADAYFSAGQFADGSELSDQELDQLTDQYSDLLHDKVHDSLYESDVDTIRDRAGIKKSDVPAYKRKAAGEKPLDHDDLRRERERNISGSEGLAALKKRMGMIEDDQPVDESLKGWILGAAATLAAILGGNELQYQHALKTDPQLIKLVQHLETAKARGDQDKVEELKHRIKVTFDHNSITDAPVVGDDGKPVDPQYEAEYHGREVPLGKPMQGDVKKSKVYVRDPKTGNVKKVNFGDPNMTIKKSNPARRKSFRARHNCDNPGPRTKARYWSC